MSLVSLIPVNNITFKNFNAVLEVTHCFNFRVFCFSDRLCYFLQLLCRPMQHRYFEAVLYPS